MAGGEVGWIATGAKERRVTAHVTWSNQSKADLNDFIDHYSALDPAFAESVSTQAVAATRLLALHPHAGQKIKDKSVRKWPVKDTPLLLIYEVDGQCVQIVRLVHNRSDWQSLF